MPVYRHVLLESTGKLSADILLIDNIVTINYKRNEIKSQVVNA